MGRAKINKERVIERYREGHSVARIAKDYRVSREAVYKVLRKIKNFNSLKERLDNKRKEEAFNEYSQLDDDIYKLREDGLGIVTISKSLGVPRRHVLSVLKGTDLDNTMEKIRDRNKQILILHKNGVSQSKIAKKFNTTQPNISNILHRHFEDELNPPQSA